MAPTQVSEVHGHEATRRDLAAAVARDELPGSILIHGPSGVGRQTLARWLARLLVCERPAEREPCGECHGCRLALDLQHPDIHWFFPVPRPKGTSGPERLAEALEDARFAALEERRRQPLYRPASDEPTGLYLAQVRTMRRLGATRPAMARRQVFIVGDAEALVPQEASEEAANALLKILEEPPPATTFILTAAKQEALLPTIRSRLLPVRLRPFTEDQIRAFLVDRAGVDPKHATLLARLGQGSIGRALAFLPRDGDDSPAQEARQIALDWLEAALDPRPEVRFAAALGQRPVAARGAFDDALAFLTLALRDLAADAAGAHDQVVDTEAIGRFRDRAARLPTDAIPDAIALVEAARDGARINANPQLTLAWLLSRLAGTLGR